MEMWTREQTQAIEARNGTLLVSAAAGSGKTAVLVERIVGLLREGARLDRMLIATFTRAAAAEMRQRLNQRLLREAAADPDVMGQALDQLEGAEISTIHAFCQKVIRNSFQTVGVDPMARICDEQQQQTLFENAFVSAMNELLEGDDADFHAFADAFDQQETREMTRQLYTFLMSLPNPFDWLRKQIDAVTADDYTAHPWYGVLVAQAARQIEGMGAVLETQRRMLNEPDAAEALRATWQGDLDAYRALLAAQKGGTDALRQALATFGFAKAAVCRGLSDAQKAWKERYAKLRDQLKALVKDATDALTLRPAQTDAEFHVMQRHLRGLARLTERTCELFREEKAQQNVLDFSDLEQYTLAILQRPDDRARMQAEYDHLFVDECQDVSAVQDAILQLIHGEDSCLFMVGDVKQSIYRFRLADPTLFLTRMRTFSDEKAAAERRISLQRNFRSRAAVLDATNRVFRRVMRSDVTELDYLPEDELIPGRETADDPPVEVRLVDLQEAEDMTALQGEAQVIARRVKELTEAGFQYRDMVILLPKVARTGAELASLLQASGVPVYFDGAESFFGLPEIQSMTALLSVLDNPKQDVMLLAALRLPPFRLTDEELAEIRLCLTGQGVPFHEAFDACREGDGPLAERVQNVAEQLEAWRFRSEGMRLTDFLWYLLRETGYYAACGALPEGALRQANLRLLCQRAAEYEEIGGTTLGGFLTLLTRQQAAGDSRSARILGENENLVRIMTIHKSKGLEFPVVFLAQLGGRLHQARKGGLRTHPRLGVCLPYVNRELNIRRPTMADAAFEVQRLLDEKAERARLLYVAMTRARERLILIGSAEQPGKPSWTMPESAYRVWCADSMLDWVMQAVTDDGACAPWQVTWESAEAAKAAEAQRTAGETLRLIEELARVPAGEAIKSAWAERPAAEAQPLKTSVSSLVRKQVLHDPLPLTGEEEDEDEKRRRENIVMPLRLDELPAQPAFMEARGVTGAERGTLIHRALALMPLSTLRGVQTEEVPGIVRVELNALIARGCFTPEESRLLDAPGIAAWFLSELGQRMLSADVVKREWAFNLLLDAGDAMLQGVIDCAFLEDGRWVLVDYKTDHIADESAFVTRYAPQLNWYARALERITAHPVGEMWLYAIAKEKAYNVSHETLEKQREKIVSCETMKKRGVYS